jgi:catechol 2,3-dioxygenase-like lactoylglutathione lyase family enzyme
MTILRRVARNVAHLTAATAFYTALGFEPLGAAKNDSELATILQIDRAMSQFLRLGAQQLELTQCTPPGAAYPAHAKSNDACFQHIAIITQNIFQMQEHALQEGATPISHGGPQRLPKQSGGATAWKFRDPDGHPLEFLQLPHGAAPGYDHSAICVRDPARSIRFYQALGLTLGHQQLNQGQAQARLDGLDHGEVKVVAMLPQQAPPHLELLGYPTVANALWRPNDSAADRLVFTHAEPGLTLQRDPDGHFILLDGRSR